MFKFLFSGSTYIIIQDSHELDPKRQASLRPCSISQAGWNTALASVAHLKWWWVSCPHAYIRVAANAGKGMQHVKDATQELVRSECEEFVYMHHPMCARWAWQWGERCAKH
jgi:hypothetical protein